MPLLEGPRDVEAVNGSVHNGLQPVQPVNGLQPVQPVDAILETDAHSNGGNKRQKIVVVGLGMVAISFM